MITSLYTVLGDKQFKVAVELTGDLGLWPMSRNLDEPLVMPYS